MAETEIGRGRMNTAKIRKDKFGKDKGEIKGDDKGEEKGEDKGEDGNKAGEDPAKHDAVSGEVGSSVRAPGPSKREQREERGEEGEGGEGEGMNAESRT